MLCCFLVDGGLVGGGQRQARGGHQVIQQSCAGGEGRPEVDAPGATWEESWLVLLRSILLIVARGKYGVGGSRINKWMEASHFMVI